MMERGSINDMVHIRVPTIHTTLVCMVMVETRGTFGFRYSYQRAGEYWDELAIDLGSLPAVLKVLEVEAGEAVTLCLWDPEEATRISSRDPRRMAIEEAGVAAAVTFIRDNNPDEEEAGRS